MWQLERIMACNMRIQPRETAYMLDAKNNLVMPAPNAYTTFQILNKGKGFSSKRMASEYRKALAGHAQQLDVQVTNTITGPALAIRPATGRYSRAAYIDQLKPLPLKSVDEQFKEMLRLKSDTSAVHELPRKTNALGDGTFNEGYMHPRPDTVRVNFSRGANYTPKRDHLTYETNALKDMAPDAYRVFTRLHAKNTFMLTRQSKARVYRKWRDNFYKIYNYNEGAIRNKLNKIIDENKLNPSKRIGQDPLEEQRCTGKNYFYDDATKQCIEPTYENFKDTYLKTPYMQSRILNMLPLQKAELEARMKQIYDSGNFDMRDMGVDRYYGAKTPVINQSPPPSYASLYPLGQPSADSDISEDETSVEDLIGLEPTSAELDIQLELDDFNLQTELENSCNEEELNRLYKDPAFKADTNIFKLLQLDNAKATENLIKTPDKNTRFASAKSNKKLFRVSARLLQSVRKWIRDGKGATAAFVSSFTATNNY